MKALLNDAELVVQLDEVETHDDAIRLEHALILKYGRLDLGTGTLFNLTDGERCKSNHSPELQARRSQTMKDKWKDPEYRAKRAGWHHTAEHKERLSAELKARWADPQWREKTNQAQKAGWKKRKVTNPDA